MAHWSENYSEKENNLMELFKVKNNFSNQIMQEIFEKPRNLDYNLRCQTDFFLPSVNRTYFGLNSLTSKIWNVIPDDIKTSLKWLAWLK